MSPGTDQKPGLTPSRDLPAFHRSTPLLDFGKSARIAIGEESAAEILEEGTDRANVAPAGPVADPSDAVLALGWGGVWIRAACSEGVLKASATGSRTSSEATAPWPVQLFPSAAQWPGADEGSVLL
jgi:hypothetical protein